MGKQWKQCQTLFWGAPKSLQMVTTAMKLKDAYFLEGKLWPTKHIKKQRYYFANRGPSSKVQFSSVTQSCLTHCNPMNRSTPGLPAHHHLLEFTQTHGHRVREILLTAFSPWGLCLCVFGPASLFKKKFFLQYCLWNFHLLFCNYVREFLFSACK